MNVDRIFNTMNQCNVAYLLIGGMNFLLRHAPVTTYDVDLWIEDSADNRKRCEQALADLDAEWGQTDADWGLVRAKASGWLTLQPLFCLNSPSGAIDVFRTVAGLTDWQTSRRRAVPEQTSGGVKYYGINDGDMLQCQYALDAGLRKADRIRVLEQSLKNSP